MAYQLATGVTVLGGGARGIETAAHQLVLNGKGPTIAVLGTVLNLYPAEGAHWFLALDFFPGNAGPD